MEAEKSKGTSSPLKKEREGHPKGGEVRRRDVKERDALKDEGKRSPLHQKTCLRMSPQGGKGERRPFVPICIYIQTVGKKKEKGRGVISWEGARKKGPYRPAHPSKKGQLPPATGLNKKETVIDPRQGIQRRGKGRSQNVHRRKKTPSPHYEKKGRAVADGEKKR